MANGAVLFIPPNDVHITQENQLIPDTVIQPPGIPHYTGQMLVNPNNECLLSYQVRLWEKFLKAEPKTLGAIQIIIGLMHIGFGSVSAVNRGLYFFFPIPIAVYAGYPFWGGLSFIASGSLSVAAEKRKTIFLIKRSMQMNIASAIMAVTGAVLYITDLAISPVYYSNGKSVGLGLAILLLLFSTLEFCITIWTAHFGCEATSSDSDMGMMAIPYTISAGGMFPSEVCLSPPPPYDFVASAEK